MDAVYGANTVLPVAASYNNKPVAFKNSDIKFLLENDTIGTIHENVFVGNEVSGVKVVKVTVCLANDETVCGTMTLNMFKQGALCGVLQQLFKEITSVAPYILAALLLYCACKGGKALWLEHGVSAREGDIGKGVGKDYLEYILYVGIVSVPYVP